MYSIILPDLLFHEQKDNIRHTSFVFNPFINGLRQSTRGLPGGGKNIIEMLREEYIAGVSDPYSFDFINNRNIWESGLYKFCQQMPKGGDLHVHADALLPVSGQIAFMADHDELKICTNGEDFGKIIYSSDDSNVPAGFKTMKECLASGLTEKDFINAWTMAGCPSGTRLWDWFQGIFDKNLLLLGDDLLVEDYYTRAFTYYCENGIEIIHCRQLFFGNNDDALKKGKALYRAMNNVRKKYPGLIVRLVGCGLKDPETVIYNDILLDNALYVHENLKDGNADFLAAIDLVNEEDISLPLESFRELLSNAKNKHSRINITLHCGESNKPDNREIASALSLGATHLGHGYNLYRYPELLQQVSHEGICLEVCPVSNIELGLCPDCRNHPAKDYFRQGVHMVLSSDDPTFLEHTALVDDFFAAIVAWDLTTEEVMTLCKNSIKYSYLSNKEKTEALASWNEKWNQLVFLWH